MKTEIDKNKGAIDILILLPIVLGILLIIIASVVVFYVISIRHDQFLRARLFPPKSLVKASGNLKDDCEYILGKAKDYIPLINKYAEQYGVDPALVAGVIQVESSWNPSATSTVGAGGLMQVMPETAQGIANQLGVQYDPTSAEQNIQFGTYYISQQLNSFGGNIDLALAAYNAGPGAASSGAWASYPETLAYVPYVKSWYEKYQECLEQASSGTNIGTLSDNQKDLINQISANSNIQFPNGNSNLLNELDISTLQALEAMGESGNGSVVVTSLTDGTHSEGSLHYSGQAIDILPNDNLQKWIYENRQDLQINELFGPIVEYQVDEGNPYPYNIGGHDDHIHIATY